MKTTRLDERSERSPKYRPGINESSEIRWRVIGLSRSVSTLVSKSGETNSMDMSDQLFDVYLSASNKQTSQLKLYCFIFHQDERIRARVAENPRVPATCLAQLAVDDSPEVRISVADNPCTPMWLLELLARDEHPDVRYAIAENANIPLHLLEFLTRDEHPYVADRAGKTLGRLQSLRTNLPGIRRCA